MTSYSKSRKISELQTIRSLSGVNKNKANSWIPAALYDSYSNSYVNVNINLEAITNYCNSYSSYVLSYTLSNYVLPEITYVTYNNEYSNVDNDEIISYVTTYTSYLLDNAVQKLSDKIVKLCSSNIKHSANTSYITNNSKKISELAGRDTITKHKDHSWLAIAQYDSRDDTYRNIAMNLNTITEYCNSYTTYNLLDINERLKSQENTINKILSSYLAYITNGSPIPPSYIMSYCTTYTAYLIKDAATKISNNMVILINNLKNRTGSSYFRNNSKKISELRGRDEITKYQDHSWFAVAQYDQRTNSYHNIALNLGTITSYVNTYSSNLLAYNVNNIYDQLAYITYNVNNNSVSYVENYLKFQYLEDGYEPIISLEDIENLIIEKKFVTFSSDNFTPEAVEYIKTLAANNESVLFDTYTHLIWAFNQYFGADILKKDLLYYSRINAIDYNDNLINTLEALGPEQSLGFKSNKGISIDLKREDDKDLFVFGIKPQELINQTVNSKYILYVDDDGKVGIKEYIKPILNFEKQDYQGSDIIEIEYELISEIPIDEWKSIDISTENCEFIELDKENNKIKIQVDPENYVNDIIEKITINYDDGYSKGEIIIDNIYNVYCYYGCYDEKLLKYIELGKYCIVDDKIDYIFNIAQNKTYYAYYRCPLKYIPLFVDNIRQSQGAWHKGHNTVINNKVYKTYTTDNLGLGYIQWKVLENIH